jgi:hypothetical protein
MFYIVGINNVLKIMDMKNWDKGEVYLISMVAVEDPIHPYANILC